MSNESAQALMQQMLRKTLYVALRKPKDLSRLPDYLQEHLQWAIRAEARGELFASGPFAAEGEPPGSQGGMTILRAASLHEAEQILAEDPFIRDGLYTVEVRQWTLMEGSLSVNVRFSDRSYRLF